jgi:hypothetical protein
MRVKKAVKQGTAADSSKVADGYVASGESSYSRRAANPDHVRLPSYEKNRKHGPRSNASHLQYQRAELERLQRKATIEHAPVKLAKLRKNIEAKTRFVARLEREEQERAEGIQTIHGADEYERW